MFNTATVPSDMWICGSCNGPNLIALAKDQCPVCGHTRDNCCKGPGQQYQMSSFCTYDNDVGDYENFDAYELSQPVGSTAYPYALSCSSTFSASPLRHCIIPGFNEYSDGAGSPAPGSWICKVCGTANSSLTPDFCPACGASRT